MKKLLCVLLALALLLAAGCSNPFSDDDDDDDTTRRRNHSVTDDDDDWDDDDDDWDDDDDDGDDRTTGQNTNKQGVKITPTAARSTTLTTYDNGLISLKVPAGWRVDIPQVDYIHYSFRVYDPNNMNYMFLFSLKVEGFLKSETARNTYRSLYPTAIFSQLAPIDPQTTEAYFKVWNENATYSNTKELGYSYFPMLTDFTVLQNLGASPLGGDILRATYKNDAGETNQGLFTASVYDPGSYYIYGVDVFPLNVYNTILMVAPDADFVNWQPIYDECIASLQFSTTFVNGFNAEERQLVSTIIANQRVYDSISDMIMDSWEKRSNSYDIISQKQSDATLGYERVYDTETNEIYRATNGFSDYDWNGRYAPVTDDMYSLPVDGYIQLD